MNCPSRPSTKLYCTRLQRFLLFSLAFVWFLVAVLARQRDYQDSWILAGVIWPFVAFAAVFIVVVWMEDDNRYVALLCTGAVAALLLVPSLKYTQLYGQTGDSVSHYLMVKDLMTTGRVPAERTYESIAGMHSWLAALGITSGLLPEDVVRYGFPLSGCIMPLLLYWICRRLRMPSDPTKYILCTSVLATYPFHDLTGTGFTLVPLMLFLGIVYIREYLCDTPSANVTYTILLLLVLLQLTIWHSTTPLLVVLLLVVVSLTPVLVWLITGRTGQVKPSRHLAELGILAGVLVVGYHSVEFDPVFRISTSTLYQLITTERDPAAALPASLFSISLLDTLKVFLVMYGREAFLFVAAGIGMVIIWRRRRRLGSLLSFFVYLFLVMVTFIATFPVSALGLDFRRLMWAPLAISPFFAGVAVWQLREKLVAAHSTWRWVSRGAAGLAILAATAVFAIEFYCYQPLVPKSTVLTPETPDEYVVWLHHVNSAYQYRMLTFAESYSGPNMLFDIDIYGNRQYIRYFGSARNRALYLPLHPMYGWNVPETAPAERLFLLHWPGPAGGYGEQVLYRSVKNLNALRDTVGWDLIYDNGESFIIHMQ